MDFANRVARVVVAMCVATALAACGGGGGGGDALPPALTLTSDSPSSEAVEGSSGITLSLTGATADSGTVTWSLNPSLGALTGTSAKGAVYTPPGMGTVTAPTVVAITATPANGSAATLQFTITLVPFEVAGVTPGAGDHVDVTVQPTITFTRAIAPSPSASSATLASPVAAVPASIATHGATLSLSPTPPLVWGGHYTISLTSDLMSAVGQPVAPTSVSFDVAAPTWSAPAQLAVSTFTAGSPVVAMNESGHAFAAWQQDTDGTGTWNIQAARFDVSTRAWSARVALHPGNRSQAAPGVAIDVTGNAIAAWSEDTGNFVYNIYAARFVAAQGTWGPATLIQTVLGRTAQAPQVVMDADGNGTVVWQQYNEDESALAVYASRFDVSSGSWRPAVQLDPSAVNPKIALDASGNAVAVWERTSDSGMHQIAAARWSQSAGTWGAAQVIQVSSLRGSNPQLAVAPNGDATVVWTQAESNGTLTIQACRGRSEAGSWSAPVALTPATGVNGGNWPQAKADPAGNVIVLWYQYRDIALYSVDAARFDVASGQWSPPAHIETVEIALNINPYSYEPTLVVDAAGNATAVWPRDVGGSIRNVFQARFDSHAGAWSAASPLSGPVNVGPVFTAVDAQGEVLATWAVTDIYAFGTPWWALLTGR